jgi:hypothetical protein
MEKDSLQSQYPEATNYTFLDFLLNNNHYRLFHQLYQAINASTVESQNSNHEPSTPPGLEERRNMEMDKERLDCSPV